MPTTIDTLPEEVLEHIFHRIDDEHASRSASLMGTQDHPRLKVELHPVVLVCSQWKKIVDANGSFKRIHIGLWHDDEQPSQNAPPGLGTLGLNDQIKKTLKALSSSVTCDLSAGIHFRVESIAAANALPIQDITNCFQQLFSHSHQLLNLGISWSGESLSAKFWPLCCELSRLPLPRLRGFSLVVSDDAAKQSRTMKPLDVEKIKFLQANNLQFLSLTGIDVLDGLVPTAGLLSLEMETRRTTAKDWTEVHSMLCTMPGLRRLRWRTRHNTSYELPVHTLPRGSGSLPRLTHLHIDGSQQLFAIIIKSIHLPELEVLDFVLETEGNNGDPKVFRSCLTALPRLKAVSIRADVWTLDLEYILSDILPANLEHFNLSLDESWGCRNLLHLPKIRLPEIKEFKLLIHDVKPDWRSLLLRIDISRVQSLDFATFNGFLFSVVDGGPELQEGIDVSSLRELRFSQYTQLAIMKSLLATLSAPHIRVFSDSCGLFFQLPALAWTPRWFDSIEHAEISIQLDSLLRNSRLDGSLSRFPNCRSLEVVLLRGNLDDRPWADVDAAVAEVFVGLASSTLPHLSQLKITSRKAARFDPFSRPNHTPFQDLPQSKAAVQSAVTWRAQNGMPSLTCSFFTSDPPQER